MSGGRLPRLARSGSPGASTLASSEPRFRSLVPPPGATAKGGRQASDSACRVESCRKVGKPQQQQQQVLVQLRFPYPVRLYVVYFKYSTVVTGDGERVSPVDLFRWDAKEACNTAVMPLLYEDPAQKIRNTSPDLSFTCCFRCSFRRQCSLECTNEWITFSFSRGLV